MARCITILPRSLIALPRTTSFPASKTMATSAGMACGPLETHQCLDILLAGIVSAVQSTWLWPKTPPVRRLHCNIKGHDTSQCLHEQRGRLKRFTVDYWDTGLIAKLLYREDISRQVSEKDT